jgi:uncharacterized delta-60 repeat protein
LLSRSLLLGVVAALSLGAVAQAAPGDLDSSFGNGGRAILTPGGHEVVYSDVAIQPDGKIVLAGYIRSSAGDNDIAVTRLNANGTPDQGFAAGGTLAINTTFGGPRDCGRAAARRQDRRRGPDGHPNRPQRDHRARTAEWDARSELRAGRGRRGRGHVVGARRRG